MFSLTSKILGSYIFFLLFSNFCLVLSKERWLVCYWQQAQCSNLKRATVGGLWDISDLFANISKSVFLWRIQLIQALHVFVCYKIQRNNDQNCYLTRTNAWRFMNISKWCLIRYSLKSLTGLSWIATHAHISYGVFQ